MVDKKLLALLGKDRKYIGWTVGLMVAGLGANLAFTASICKALEMAVRFREYGERGEIFLLPVFVAMACGGKYMQRCCGWATGREETRRG